MLSFTIFMSMNFIVTFYNFSCQCFYYFHVNVFIVFMSMVSLFVFHVFCYCVSCFLLLCFVLWCYIKRVDTFCGTGLFGNRTLLPEWICRPSATRTPDPSGQVLGTSGSEGPQKFPPRRVFPGSTVFSKETLLRSVPANGPKDTQK